MTRTRGSLAACLTALAWPGAAQAQAIPAFAVVLAVSPLVLLVLSLVLGAVTRSRKRALLSLLLGAFWILWFMLASRFTESDALIWAPVIGMWTQSVLLLVWALWAQISRLRAPRDDS